MIELVKGGEGDADGGPRGTVELKGDGFRFLTPGMDEITQTAATFKLDSSKSPKAIDVTVTDGVGKGQTLKGIYESDGEDLKLCLTGEPVEARPTEFLAEKGELVLFKLKRSKK